MGKPETGAGTSVGRLTFGPDETLYRQRHGRLAAGRAFVRGRRDAELKSPLEEERREPAPPSGTRDRHVASP